MYLALPWSIYECCTFLFKIVPRNYHQTYQITDDQVVVLRPQTISIVNDKKQNLVKTARGGWSQGGGD